MVLTTRISAGKSEELLSTLPVFVFQRLLDDDWTVSSESVRRLLAELGYQCCFDQAIAWRDFVSPQDVLHVLQEIRQQLGQREHYAIAYRLCTAAGATVWVQEQGKGIYDERGELQGVEGLLVILQEDIRRDQHLLKERQVLQQLIMDAPVAIAMFDRQMNYLAYSYQWLLDFEIETEENTLLGRSHYELFPDLPQDWYEVHQQALGGEDICRAEEPFVLPSGKLLYLRRSIQPWYAAPGEVGGIIIVNQVINQLVEAREEAIALADMKSQFLATMSHELRTPLSGVISVAELLMKTRLSPRQADLTETLIKSAQHLRLVINDILDFSKLEAEALRLESLDFDFYEEIDFLTELLGEDAHKKGVHFSTLVDPHIPRWVCGDPLRLRQILTNLISNAIKFTQEGEIILRVESLERTTQQLLLKFSVTDTGIGISPQVQQRLFQAFTQADVDISRKYGGTGLGLAITKQLVELMGGHIALDSAVGRGSTFWFTIPLRVAAQGTDKAPTLIFNGNDQGMLFVGKQAASQRLIRFYGSHCGMPLRETETIQAAIALLASQTYQLMFVEFASVKDDLAQLRDIQAQYPATQMVMILHPLEHHKLIQIHPNAPWQYLFEPIQIKHLFACFQDILQGDIPAVEKPEPRQQPVSVPPAPIDTKILVVDDAEINRSVITSQLKYLGYHDITCVTDGEGALKAIAEREYDIILMDCMMPHLNGLQTTQLIRQQFSPSALRPVIIAMTANSLPEDHEECLRVGMNDYLVKPTSIALLQKTLTHWGDRQRAATQIFDGEAAIAPENTPMPLIDFERLEKLIPNDPQWTCEFLQDFQVTSEQYADAIHLCIQTEDVAKTEYYAHQLKGVARMAAVNVVPHIAHQIEQLATQRDWTAIAQELRQLRFYLAQVHQKIDEFCRLTVMVEA